MPTLETLDGKPVDVTPPDPDKINSDFSRAMNDDGPDTQATPRRQRRTPVPDDEAAPKPRRGRPPKEEKARATEAPAVKDDYTEDAQGLVGSVWTVAACISVTQPYALVVETNSDQLVKALADGAKQNATIRAWVSSGQSSWVLGLATVSLNMGLQAFQLMRDPELREQAAAKTRANLKEAIGAKNIEINETETANAA